MKFDRYVDLVNKITQLERKIEHHEEREKDLLHMYSECQKARFYRDKYLTINEVMEKIPFELFDLRIDNKFHNRCVDKEYLCKLLNWVYGYLNNGELKVLDVFISTTEGPVIIITDIGGEK